MRKRPAVEATHAGRNLWADEVRAPDEEYWLNREEVPSHRGSTSAWITLGASAIRATRYARR